MSNNDIWCERCKSNHHPTDCPMDAELDQPAPEGGADRQLLEQARDAMKGALCHMGDDRGTQRAEDRGTVYETLAALNKRLGEGEHDKVW